MIRTISRRNSIFPPVSPAQTGEARDSVGPKKGAPAGAPSVTRSGRSGLAARKAHRRGAGAVIGLDVDEADHALLDLAPGAVQGWADLLGLFDIFGVAAQGLGHLVVAGVAEITAGLVVFGVGGPAAVQADDAEERQFV